MPELPLSECYRLLELSPGAGAGEAREAYRALSRVWHPDRFAGNADLLSRANARQQELNAAYERLLQAIESGEAGVRAEGGQQPPAEDAGPWPGTSPRDGGHRGPAEVSAEAIPGGLAGRGIHWAHARWVWAKANRAKAVAGGAALIVGGTLLLNAALGSGGAVRAAGGAPLNAAALSIGGSHACVANAAGVACWGRNDLGQAGVSGTGALSRATPVTLPGGVVAVAAGLAHSCALLSTGEVQCWGGNFAGQLGDRSLQDRSSPAAVAGPGRYEALSSLTRHTCALTRGGDIRCWGDDTDGQLGTGAPVAACRLDDVSFHCSDRPELVGQGPAWASVSSGGSHTCAIDTAGVAYCWGSDRYGQLGGRTAGACTGPGGAQPCSRRPEVVQGLAPPVVSIVAGASHSCALDASGQAWCWGMNEFGQSGTGGASATAAPHRVDTGLRFRSLVAGGYHTCGITKDSALYCWGRDSDKELRGLARDRCGDARCARQPVELEAAGVALVAGGFGRTCIAGADGEVRCWGNGAAALAPDVLSPAAIPAVGRFWRNVVWLAGSAHRFIDRNILVPFQELAR